MKKGVTTINPVGILKILFVAVIIAAFMSACKKSNDDQSNIDCSGMQRTFLQDVSPVIQASCATSAGCHGAGSANGPGSLLNWQQVFDARVDIRSAVASGHMPLNGSLTATEKSAIVCWIDNGAPDN